MSSKTPYLSKFIGLNKTTNLMGISSEKPPSVVYTCKRYSNFSFCPWIMQEWNMDKLYLSENNHRLVFLLPILIIKIFLNSQWHFQKDYMSITIYISPLVSVKVDTTDFKHPPFWNVWRYVFKVFFLTLCSHH